MGKELQEKPETALAAHQDYGDDAGAGFEQVGKDERIMPFINVLQKTSPDVDEIEGAVAGMLINSTTKEVADAEVGIVFQPVFWEKKWVRWAPRESQESYLGSYEDNNPKIRAMIAENGGSPVPPKDAGGKRVFKVDDEEVVLTYYLYGNILDDEGNEIIGQAVISCTSTKIKAFKAWLNAVMALKHKPPIYANRMVIKSSKQKNEHGTFFTFNFRPFGGDKFSDALIPAGSELITEGKTLRRSVIEGSKVADLDAEGAERSGGASGSDAGEKPKPTKTGEGLDDEEIPF